MDRRNFLIQSGKAALGTTLYPFMNSEKHPHNAGYVEREPLTLFLSGDVMTGRGIDQVLPHSVNPQLHETYVKDALQYVKLARRHSGSIPDEVSYEYVWGDALDILNETNPDLRIVNLETSVTTSSNWWKRKRIHYRMHPANTPLLTTAGIDACILGNNHMLDWGYEGLRETLETLHEAGIATAGAGTDEASAVDPAVLQSGANPDTGKAGRLLLFSWATPDAGAPLSWSAGEEQPGLNILQNLTPKYAEKVIRSVKRHRREGDRIVISLHWGGNWGYEVPPEQRSFAHQLIDAGAADLIHGHSSHHPKGIEVYDGRPVLYGCGDLINDYEGISGHEEYRSELSLMYFPRLDATGKLSRFEMIPMKMHRFRLTRTTEEETEWLADMMDRECRKFGTSVDREGDTIVLSHDS